MRFELCTLAFKYQREMGKCISKTSLLNCHQVYSVSLQAEVSQFWEGHERFEKVFIESRNIRYFEMNVVLHYLAGIN